jgi:hypothetical protein
MKKFFSLFLVVTVLLSMSMVYGADVSFPKPGGTPAGISTPIGNILGAIQFIGAAFAVGMLIVLGVKYVMASAQEKADLKKGMLSYVIGAVMIGAASSLPALIAGMVKF